MTPQPHPLPPFSCTYVFSLLITSSLLLLSLSLLLLLLLLFSLLLCGVFLCLCCVAVCLWCGVFGCAVCVCVCVCSCVDSSRIRVSIQKDTRRRDALEAHRKLPLDSCPINVLRNGREQHIPDSSNHSLYLLDRCSSPGIPRGNQVKNRDEERTMRTDKKKTNRKT